MNTTTAIRRNLLLDRQDLRLRPKTARRQPAPPPAEPAAPQHDFLVLNQHPALTAEALPPAATARNAIL
ncbi:MAG TPA: hypothetical protein VG838_11335 [Opitutaceae bacterium]|nr:hypothetical protein [Opitutaceae bacterium]